jgi:dolichyl-phosphate beta-glucosyltransferase
MSIAQPDVDLSIVVPAYNEEDRLAPTLESIAAFLAGRGDRFEILVVDDGSTDGTVDLVRRLGREIPALSVIETRPNRGKGHAVRVGMLAARGAVRVMCDADGSTPPTELPKLLEALARGPAAVAIGSRYLGSGAAAAGCAKVPVRIKQPRWRRAWSRLCNLVVRRTLVPGIRDTQCGFKAFTAAAAGELFGRATVDGWAFDLEVLALAGRLGFQVAEVAVDWRDDRRSRVRPLHDLGVVVREAAAIHKNLVRGAYGDLRPRLA